MMTGSVSVPDKHTHRHISHDVGVCVTGWCIRMWSECRIFCGCEDMNTFYTVHFGQTSIEMVVYWL